MANVLGEGRQVIFGEEQLLQLCQCLEAVREVREAIDTQIKCY